MSDKYIVYKAEDWDHFVRLMTNLMVKNADEEVVPVFSFFPEAVADAEVFRHQDLVAAPIFYNASSIYQSYLELMKDHLTPAQVEYMKEVVDHFFEAAERSTGLPSRKLPD